MRKRATALCAGILILASAALPDPTLAGPADLDPGLGGGGLVTTPLPGGDATANAVALAPDGKVVVAGKVGDDFLVARYLSDGSLDQSFSGDGIATPDLGPAAEATGVVVQPDGKVIAAGSVGEVTFDSKSARLALVRYSVDGREDPTFSGDGIVIDPLGLAHGVALAADGSIVVGGAPFVTLARYLPDGSPDLSFGSDGVVHSESAFADALVMQNDGKVVTAGAAPVATGGEVPSPGFEIARFGVDGSLDRSLGGAGTAAQPCSGSGLIGGPSAVAVGPGGQIAVAGYCGLEFGRLGQLHRLEVMSFDSDGGETLGFANVRFPSVTDTGRASASAVGFAPDGKVVAAGSLISAESPLTASDFLVTRFDANGGLDFGFSRDGTVTTLFNPQCDLAERAAALAIGPDGDVIVAGDAEPAPAGNSVIALARYGTPDAGAGETTCDRPETTITELAKKRRPGSKVEAVFTFRSDESESTFRCRLKGRGATAQQRRVHPCGSPQRYRVGSGNYAFTAVAIDRDDNADTTPAKRTFRVGGG